MDYLAELNDVQREAVEYTEGPSMVVAGAGSGKTRVLTYRIAHLVRKGADPFNILALTFTNKAAREMKERIGKIVGIGESRNLWMGTFHSVFARILRSEAEKLGYPSNFTIYDTQDAKNLLKTIIKELSLDENAYKPNLVYNRISAAKNSLISASAYASNTVIQSEDQQSAKPRIHEIYKIYEQRCFKAAAMDFDDLLFKTNILLRDFPDVLYNYQHRFKYILVDEYQDTNFSQYIIIKKLAALNENICVVGDDAQSIYSFRGANIQNILNFKKDYPDVKIFKLEQNYRSTQTIVNAANSIIALNKEQIKKEVWTSNDEGERIVVRKTHSDNEEGAFVAASIFETKMNHYLQCSDFAILYRTNAQSRAMEEALRKKDIPYRIYGGLSFYQRKEIKDLLAYFRLVINPNDEEAFKRIINYPARGIGKTTLDRLIMAANQYDKSLWEIACNAHQLSIGLNKPTTGRVQEFVKMIASFNHVIQTKDAYELGQSIASTCGLLKELFADRTPEGISRYENIQELLNGLKEFSDKREEGDTSVKTLAEFMSDIALLTDADETDKTNQNHVSLMTIHAAKGLEFPYVYIVGLEENLFPSQLSLMSRPELEEERRLFYVALTRAEKRVTLSYATNRYKWGNLIYCEPSRFLEELDQQYIDSGASQAQPIEVNTEPTAGGSRFQRKNTGPSAATQRKLVRIYQNAEQKSNGAKSASTLDLEVGEKVNHERFGKGVILALEGEMPNQKAIIDFSAFGKKQLLLKFARLEKI
jgi:DNA helicase-2/ATP-dependent DNA helicase PcrA